MERWRSPSYPRELVSFEGARYDAAEACGYRWASAEVPDGDYASVTARIQSVMASLPEDAVVRSFRGHIKYLNGVTDQWELRYGVPIPGYIPPGTYECEAYS